MAELAQGVGATGGAGRRALLVVSRARSSYGALPANRQRWLLLGGVLVLAVASAVTWFAGRTDWRVLFAGLEGKDVQTVSQELAAAGIPYSMTPDGTGVQVPAEMLDKARMEVAAKGMPQTGRLGFELFDKPNWVGSEFDEKVNYQRALEGELEHTIGTLGVVRSARVHLVLPRETLFTVEQKAAKASVVLKLKRSSLSAEQTESIRTLVASAVENLSPVQVTLVDADGRVNLAAHNGNAGGGDAEQAMEAKLVAMLEPLAGAGNVRATVNVSVDAGSEERTDEVVDPALTAATSMQKTEQTNGGTARASGVPGTASNTPAAGAPGGVQGSNAAAAPGLPPLLQGKAALPVYPQTGGATQSMKEESATYAVSRHIVHTEQGAGRIRRVSAAVVVNDRLATEGTGKLEHAVWKPRTTEEMHRLEGLAQAAVGFDEKRGDTVVLENVSFSANAPEAKSAGLERVIEEAKSLLALQPGMMKTAVIALVGLVLVLSVLRPVATQVVMTLREPALLGAGPTFAAGLPEETSPVASVPDADSTWSAGSGPSIGAGRRVAAYDEVMEHIRRQPQQSTRLLEAWIGTEEEAG